MFINLGNAVAGFASGGPAKVAVSTNALEDMVGGSSVSNVVGTGSLTIPMMKKLGYKPNLPEQSKPLHQQADRSCRPLWELLLF